MAGTYEQIGSEADVKQISPHADEAYNMITQMLGGNIGGDLLGQWLGSIPGIQDLSGQLTGPYAEMRTQAAEQQMLDVKRNITGQYADIGALRSSAAGEALGRGMAGVKYGAMSDILGKELGLTQSLAGGAAGLLGQGLGAQTTLMGTLASAYGPTYYEPTYGYQPGFMDYLISGLGSAGQAFGGVTSGLETLGLIGG